MCPYLISTFALKTSGYHSISNVDYSELVINEMIEKNTDKRPKMQWNVGDMTSMHDIYPIDSCFDVIFDKGISYHILLRIREADTYFFCT